MLAGDIVVGNWHPEKVYRAGRILVNKFWDNLVPTEPSKVRRRFDLREGGWGKLLSLPKTQSADDERSKALFKV